ncbi:VanZ family protein [Cyclobacterium sp. 1_MG-2023]|uniref:VanZ family protein n=1 Tax=Cyclobacterium sp. 1_MG-2023 TaxID=3062681 RepID=UPI0026E456CB|nr:VanZ family protein [Cyclobacterium sp. 1_MG-2023]MDO6436455.1 VanZ family protein [Cyclobacterium sp. 1_MG-2023]
MKEKVILALLWSSGMTYALFSPSNKVPDIPKFYGSDKVIHLGMFIGMAFLWDRVIRQRIDKKSDDSNKIYTKYLVLWIFIAILTEYLQRLVPGRSFDYFDILTNIIGVIIGTGIFIYFNKRGSILV